MRITQKTKTRRPVPQVMCQQIRAPSAHQTLSSSKPLIQIRQTRRTFREPPRVPRWQKNVVIYPPEKHGHALKTSRGMIISQVVEGLIGCKRK